MTIHCNGYSLEKPKKLAWKESYQWWKLILGALALGLMGYQTYLLYLISQK